MKHKINTLLSVDLSKSAENQPTPLHNRWHPEVPAVATVEQGESFRVECIDWTGGQIQDNDSANDVRDVDLDRVHYLSGPIHVKGAQPGDLLVVDILDLGALKDSQWGFTGIFARENGGGFLTDHYPEASKAIWEFDGIYARSRHIPNVSFAGIIHPGLIGTAPSHELLERWNVREKELFDQNPDRVPPLAALPNARQALAGAATGTVAERIKVEGARTVPGRENGGNCDIKNLTRGTRAYFPVFVEGAHLSMGDMHFSQGDGEISFCGGIEMAGWLDLRVSVIKNGVSKYGITNPIFESSPLEPHYSEYLIFEGVSVDERGTQHYLDAHVAYRRACLNAIEFLKKCGYTGEQAYMLLSTAPVEGRLSGIVDIPNAVCTVAIPKAIFDFEIRPTSNGPIFAKRASHARVS